MTFKKTTDTRHNFEQQPNGVVIEVKGPGHFAVISDDPLRTVCPACGAVWKDGASSVGSGGTCVMNCCGAEVSHDSVMVQRFPQLDRTRRP